MAPRDRFERKLRDARRRGARLVVKTARHNVQAFGGFMLEGTDSRGNTIRVQGTESQIIAQIEEA